MPSRRHFITTTAGTTLALALPGLARSAASGKFRFGVITDIHQDVMHDGVERLTAFIQAMREEKVDFIVQLGDFCQPKPANQPFLAVWNQYQGPRYHVIGNHDTDGGFKREQTVAFYGMPARYYGFDQHGIRFIVLDGNDPGGKGGGYARHVAADQQAWLERELAATTLPVVILIHQPLESAGGVDNQEEVRAILEKDRGPEHPGVVACLTGHLHQDYVRRIHGIAHLQVNSASYVWLPANAQREIYDPAVHRAHPSLRNVAPYRDPLWAVVTIDHDAATLTLKGRSSVWVGPDPWARGAPEQDYPHDLQRPAISDWAGVLATR